MIWRFAGILCTCPIPTKIFMQKPIYPLPEPMRGNESGSWANSTIRQRLPEIARRTLQENDFPTDIQTRIEALIADIPDTPIRLLHGAGLDVAAWNEWVRPYRGQNWLNPPWFFTETYFYRRIIEAVDYFQTGIDPFAHQKSEGLKTTRVAIHALGAKLQDWLAAGRQVDTLATLLTIDLWGNQADLSLWPAEESEQPAHQDFALAQAFLLADDSRRVVDYMYSWPASRLDFIVDNAGFELVCDLALADYLLSSDGAEEVFLNLKIHPTFVSDATILNVEQTIAFLLNAEHAATSAWGQRLADHLANGRLHLQTHPFWTSPLAMWEMPTDLRAELSNSSLIISKGDANYRRMLGDLNWLPTTPFAGIMTYVPASWLALRTLKSEVVAGLQAEKVTQLRQDDPDWLINGRYGVIQFAISAPD